MLALLISLISVFIAFVVFSEDDYYRVQDNKCLTYSEQAKDLPPGWSFVCTSEMRPCEFRWPVKKDRVRNVCISACAVTMNDPQCHQCIKELFMVEEATEDVKEEIKEETEDHLVGASYCHEGSAKVKYYEDIFADNDDELL